ncbi:GNAT family N-acetyltransferase [Enterococcus sp. LJL98]
MKEITFKNISTIGNVLDNNQQYIHIHYPEMPVRYDSNLIAFQKMPSLDDFKETESYLRNFHLQYDQNHLKFRFPENQKLTEELKKYCLKSGYSLDFLELYVIKPENFPKIESSAVIAVQLVKKEHLIDLIQLKYQNDLEYGEDFAKQKTDLVKRQFSDSNTQQVIAYYEGFPVGYVDLILADKTVELDELTVLETYQRRGIGSQLQKFVMESFPEKSIILVADGEDTPREMYQKQNYQYLGFQYEATKENEI